MFFIIFNLYLNNKSILIIKLNKELFKECFFPNMIFLTNLSCIIISFVIFADHHLEYHFTKLFISFPKASLGPLIFRIFLFKFQIVLPSFLTFLQLISV